MQKIPSLFKRDYDGDRLVYDELVPGAEWVAEGEGVATQKHDGTCCLFDGGKLYKRYEVKKGKQAPSEFRAASPVDAKTGKQQGWVPVILDDPADRWHREALENRIGIGMEDGTYELIGPKIQGNPEKSPKHVFVRHGSVELVDAPRDFSGLRAYLKDAEIEGIVWHHPDGRMAKIKRRDFWR